VLYGTNSFNFQDDLMVRCIPKLLRPGCLHLIKSIEFEWTLPTLDQPTSSANAKASYDDLWKALALMQGLRNLRVFISTTPSREGRVNSLNNAWLLPLRRLSHLRQLTVFMPNVLVVAFKASPENLCSLELLSGLNYNQFAATFQPILEGTFHRIVGTPERNRKCISID